MSNNSIEENKDFFIRKKYRFMIQHQLESKVFSWLERKFDVEETTRKNKKPKMFIISEKEDEKKTEPSDW